MSLMMMMMMMIGFLHAMVYMKLGGSLRWTTRDAASRPIDHIALHTKLDAECEQLATSVQQGFLHAVVYDSLHPNTKRHFMAASRRKKSTQRNHTRSGTRFTTSSGIRVIKYPKSEFVSAVSTVIYVVENALRVYTNTMYRKLDCLAAV